MRGYSDGCRIPGALLPTDAKTRTFAGNSPRYRGFYAPSAPGRQIAGFARIVAL